MENKIKSRPIALLPILVFLVLYLGMGLIFEYDLKIDTYTMLKPDVSVYCKKDRQIPEIVFEVLSPSTKQRDMMIKPAKYKAAGVKEYWIIDPVSRTVIVHNFMETGTDEINIYN